MSLTEPAERIQQRWKASLSPIFNGIVLGNGTFIGIDFRQSLQDSGELEGVVVTTTDVCLFEAEYQDYWTEVTPLCELQVADSKLRILGGEGGFGGDGFVALTTVDQNELVWLAFFDHSNPFVELSLDESRLVIIAKSNLGMKWVFPLHEPQRVTIIADAKP